jgi:hypothetical protein
LSCLLGCGARTGLYYEEDDSKAQKESAQNGASNSNTGNTGNTGNAAAEQSGEAQDGRDPFAFDSEALPPCHLGTPHLESPVCKYSYDNRCYDTSNEACACACPPDRTDTFCAESLPDEFGTTPIKYCEVL